MICEKCMLYKDCYDMHDFSCNDYVEFEALKVLNKPHKRYYDSDIEEYVCPRCHGAVNSVDNYCRTCGQRLENERL